NTIVHCELLRVQLVRKQDSKSNYLSRPETLPVWFWAGRAKLICSACKPSLRRLESRVGTGSFILSFCSPCSSGDWLGPLVGSWQQTCRQCLLQYSDTR